MLGSGLAVLLPSLGYCQLEKMLQQFAAKLEEQDLWHVLGGVLSQGSVVPEFPVVSVQLKLRQGQTHLAGTGVCFIDG